MEITSLLRIRLEISQFNILNHHLNNTDYIVFYFKQCSGPSMQPTIYSDDVVLTEHLSVHRKTVSRYVCFHP